AHAHGVGPGVVLRDGRGREHGRLPDAGQRSFDGRGFELLFPGLPEDAADAHVVVPFVAVAEREGEASVTVPLAGWAIDQPILLTADLTIGAYPFQVQTARVIELFGRRLLRVDTDLGGWRDGRRLLGADRVLLDGR